MSHSNRLFSRWTDISCILGVAFVPPLLAENEKACVEKNVSTPGISIYFEAYLYSNGNYSSSSWQLPASALLAPQRRPSMGDEEDDHDSPVEGQPEKVKKPKKVYCYISPKVSASHVSPCKISHLRKYSAAMLTCAFSSNSNYP